MDKVENKYLVLPIHTKMKVSDAKKIAKLINRFIT
jgi:dTDP-4-amino-4,6-dideoxygalactose transaminase